MSRWDEALAASSGSGSIIDGMREWADQAKSSDHAEDVPRRPKQLADPQIDDQQPVEDESPASQKPEAEPSDEDGWMAELLEADEALPEPIESRPGLFSRLFGRNKQDQFDEDEVIERAESEPDWAPDDPATSAVTEKDPWAEFLADAEEPADTGPASARDSRQQR